MDHDSEAKCDHASCSMKNANNSVCQTISEMDWERGLWNAAFYGNEEKVMSLIIKSSDPRELVNTTDNAGYSPLHYAARNGHVNICAILLNFGANVNAETKCGKATPLHKAAVAGNLNTVKFLVKSGAVVNKKDIDGETAIFKATQNMNFHVVNFLMGISPEKRSLKDYKANLPNKYPED